MAPQPVVATCREHLLKLIGGEIDTRGPQCDLNHIDVSGITDMDNVFSMSKFNGDISKWDTSNVESMVEMFYDSSFNGDISRWDTSKVKRMAHMFQKSAFTGDISKWGTRNVRYFRDMFLDGAFAGDISAWAFRPQSVSELSRMFSNEQLAQLSAPNLYCWACAIAVPHEVMLRPEWQTHLQAILPPLVGLGLPVVEAAQMVHQAWQQRGLDIGVLELPELG